jgi:pseudouridine synthase
MSTGKRTAKSQITLSRALSKFGRASRSRARILIRQGQVTLNGRRITSPEIWVDPRVDKIVVAGEPLRQQARVYLALHKPAGVVTTRSDERGRKTVYDLLPEEQGWLFPVGRLDQDTSGLLLMTNDTQFGERVTSPLSKIPKTYETLLDRPLAVVDKHRMESRFRLSDGETLLPAAVEISPVVERQCTITISEGKNRQIRRMCATLGYKVVALKRISIGPVRLGGLGEGEFRALTEEERKAITLETR